MSAPAYRQIEDWLAGMIDEGRLRAGERVPPEREFAARLGVSRMTLRQALDRLGRRGLVERVVGRGTYVSAPRVEQDLRVLRSYPDELRAQGIDGSTVVIAAVTAVPPPPTARALAIAGSARAHRIDRLRSARSEPFLLESAWLPEALFPELLTADLDGSLWAALAAAGHRVLRAVERLEPVLAGAAEASALGVDVGAPLMLVERTSYDAGGRPLEFAVGWFRGDRVRFVVEVSGARREPDPPH